MGEEWRRGWHPERIRPSAERRARCWSSAPARPGSRRRCRSAGAATTWCWPRPAASSAAGWRARRGCPGWPPGSGCVDYREGQLRELPNVELAFEQRADGRGDRSLRLRPRRRSRPARAGAATASAAGTRRPVELRRRCRVLTPDDLMAGVRPDGERVVVFDDDHYYMGGVLAELLAREGRRVTLVTPGRARVGVDGEHDGAGPHPAPAAGAGRRDPNVAHGRRRPRAASVLLGCTYTEREHATRLRRAGAGDGAADPHDSLVAETAAGRGGRRARRRRRVEPGHDRRRGLGRPPLRGGARRAARTTARCRSCARSSSWPTSPPRPQPDQLGLVVIAQMATQVEHHQQQRQGAADLGQLAEAAAPP